jgi:hypothetical protein|tara:strand:- start:212 stop:469 length:258 start_codon:yes stop_codon:yes gene_type:complete
MDEDDEIGETEKITDAKKTKRTMTSNRDENRRSAATIVETDFLVRFISSGVFTSFRREVYDDDEKKKNKSRGRQNTRSSLPVVEE